MIVWCMSTWLSTEPSAYLYLPPLVTAASTASLMAMPSEPVLFGSFSRTWRPALVRSLGLAATRAPKLWIIERRCGFWSKLTRTIHTRHSRSKKLQACEMAVPHWPAPVSVVTPRTPSCLL
jgi:hypothetical protein